MKALQDHYFAIIQTFRFWINGKFLLFFIPGILISTAYILYLQQLSSYSTYIDYLDYIPWIGSYLKTGADFLYGWLEGLSLFLYQFLIISVLSPFHTILSEKIDNEITNQDFRNGWDKIITDIVRTLGVVILGGIFYLVLKLLWMLFAWILGISFLNPYVSIILIAFFTGFNSYDYSLERYSISVFQSWKFARKHILHMVLTGLIFTSLIYIPFAGVVIAPVFLTTVGTICFLRIKKRNEEVGVNS